MGAPRAPPEARGVHAFRPPPILLRIGHAAKLRQDCPRRHDSLSVVRQKLEA